MGVNSNIPIVPAVIPPHFTCEIPISYTAEDNLTYIQKATIDVVECVNIPLSTTKDWWNCNLCGSDEKYSQPVLDSDVLRYQYIINENGVNNYQAYLFDGDDEIIEDTAGIEMEIFTDGFKNKYLNITLNIEDIPSDCFYFRIYAFPDAFDEGDLEDCIDVKLSLGRGAKEAELLCRIEQQADATIYYSEMFRKTNDECENTLLFECTYPYYDCNGNFYNASPQTGTNGYNSLKVRVPATIEKSDMNFEEVIVFNTKRTSKQTDTYLLRTEKLPPYVVEQIALMFQAKSFTIDGVTYKGGKKLSKNFEEGRMWMISTTLTRDCDLDFLCS